MSFWFIKLALLKRFPRILEHSLEKECWVASAFVVIILCLTEVSVFRPIKGRGDMIQDLKLLRSGH